MLGVVRLLNSRDVGIEFLFQPRYLVGGTLHELVGLLMASAWDDHA